jgi:hypothetical protein
MHRMTTMNLGACVGYKGALATHRLSITNRNSNMVTLYSDKKFFDGKNYRWIIQCLDGGKFLSSLISISSLLI